MGDEQIYISQQILLLSAFLGGCSATFLAAILVIDSKKDIANWVVVLSAISACSFIVCATCSVAIMNNLTIIPEEVDAGRLILIKIAKPIRGASITIGLLSLLASIGVAGWLRNKKTGITTSSVAAIAMIIVWVMI